VQIQEGTVFVIEKFIPEKSIMKLSYARDYYRAFDFM